MAFGLVLASVAALCSASATLLQSIGARQLSPALRFDPRLLWRLARCGPYAAGMALDGASSGLTFAALRTAPLFAVQAVVASNLSLVALLSTVALRARMRPREWMAVLGVVCGVVLLVSSTRTGPPAPRPGWAPGFCSPACWGWPPLRTQPAPARAALLFPVCSPG